MRLALPQAAERIKRGDYELLVSSLSRSSSILVQEAFEEVVFRPEVRIPSCQLKHAKL